MLTAGEIDLAVTVIDRTIGAGLKSKTLIELSLALCLPKSSKVRTVEEVLGADRIEEPLISLRPDEALPRVFQQELARRGLAWPTSIEAGTLELVVAYAAEGFGIGLGVEIPGVKPASPIRMLPLTDFPKLPIGMLWVEKLSPVAQALCDQLETAAKAMVGTAGDALNTAG